MNPTNITWFFQLNINTYVDFLIMWIFLYIKRKSKWTMRCSLITKWRHIKEICSLFLSCSLTLSFSLMQTLCFNGSYPSWKDIYICVSIYIYIVTHSILYTSRKVRKFHIIMDFLDYWTPNLSPWLRFAVMRTTLLMWMRGRARLTTNSQYHCSSWMLFIGELAFKAL